MLIKRKTATGGNDLRTVYRPCSLEELIGNDHIRTAIGNQISQGILDHTLLFSGPSGCGKTTLARIVALTLNCEADRVTITPCMECRSCTSILNQNSIDYYEVNVGATSGKADVDNVVKDLAQGPLMSKHKIIVFDECHKLTDAAKDLLLKKMEDTYDHVYLIFCTNKPEKLIDSKNGETPFLDRCAHYQLQQLNEEGIKNLLENVCQFEGVPYTKEALGYITEISKGVPRKALKALGSIISEGSWTLDAAKALLENIILDEKNENIMELSKVLLAGKYKDAYTQYEILKKKYEAETVRVAVCGFIVYRLKTAKAVPSIHKFTRILDFFTNPIYVTGKPADHVFYNYMAKTAMIMLEK